MSAITTSVRNIVQGQIAAGASGTIQSGLRKVAGNLLGINTRFDGPQLGANKPRAERFTPQNKYTSEHLMYPLNVQEDSQQGHYILFNIYEHDEAALQKRAKFLKSYTELENRIRAENESKRQAAAVHGPRPGYPEAVHTIALKKEHQSSLEDTMSDFSALYIDNYPNRTGGPKTGINVIGDTRRHQDSSSIQVTHPATKRVKTTIALYMPPSVQVSYGAEYNDSELGVLSSIGARVFREIKENTVAHRDNIVRNLGELGVGLTRGAISALDLAASGAKAMVQIETGRAITPKMELMFNGIGRREFSYEFTFIPKSRDEAEVIKKIVNQFKFHMSADYAELTGHRLMKLPSTFEIEYQYLGHRNNFLNRISTCALQSADVSYGGDRFQAHKDGVPQQTKLNLKFKELEIITRKLTADGY